ncbi:MAG: peptidoglycan DD-metalloendopeptidase family protein [Herpetosiphon sp.]
MHKLRVILLLLVVCLSVPSGRSAAVLASDDQKNVSTVGLEGALPTPGSVQQFLDLQPGPLKQYRDGVRTAGQIIEANAIYYGLNAHIVVTLLELEHHLITLAQADSQILELPFGPSGPRGFANQIGWATRELRSGTGPFKQDPVVTFSDGRQRTLSRDQDPMLLSIQRFLAHDHSEADWQRLVDRYQPLYTQFFGSEMLIPTPTPASSSGWLALPWTPGTRVIHTAYFDHVYPTVMQGPDGNDFVVTYLGTGNVSYNTHDGHDYYFPDRPTGTTIRAAAAGMAYALTTPGNGVVIKHANGYETIYWHLDQFDRKFVGHIDNQEGVRVAAGDALGTSGKSGFTDGGAHLHFGVRHNGRHVDPYGWFGHGSDPCAAWAAGCEASVWLWQDGLRGSYDLTPPNAPAVVTHEPPVGTLSVIDDPDLRMLVHFDGHALQSIGQGTPEVTSSHNQQLQYSAGQFGQAVTVPAGVSLTYPISGNLELGRGTVAVWAKLPDQYPANGTNRHYLFAGSANADDSDARLYTDTLTLRRQFIHAVPEWNFWTVDDAGRRNDLVVSDTLQPGWHHFAITWDRAAGSKQLFVDGQLAAHGENLTLPTTVGSRLQIGRWTTGFGDIGAALDEFAIWNRVLAPEQIDRLAHQQDARGRPGPVDVQAVVHGTNVTLDANAIDNHGGIVQVQLRRDNEPWQDPQPYFDTYQWQISGTNGLHTFAIRYRNQSDDTTVVTSSVELRLPPVVTGRVFNNTPLSATLALSTTDSRRLMQQLSPDPTFVGAAWTPFTPTATITWTVGMPAIVYARFKDEDDATSVSLILGPEVKLSFLPGIQLGGTGGLPQH